MLNKIKSGRTIDVVLTAITAGGALVAVGELVGVAIAGGVIGDTIAVALDGVYEVSKPVGAGTGYPIGTILYHDTATGGVTETAGALKKAGHAYKVAADNDTTTHLRLIQ